MKQQKTKGEKERDKHSRTGYRTKGAPFLKKGGGGGKGSWGQPGCETQDVEEDVRDPNYCSDEDLITDLELRLTSSSSSSKPKKGGSNNNNNNNNKNVDIQKDVGVVDNKELQNYSSSFGPSSSDPDGTSSPPQSQHLRGPKKPGSDFSFSFNSADDTPTSKKKKGYFYEKFRERGVFVSERDYVIDMCLIEGIVQDAMVSGEIEETAVLLKEMKVPPEGQVEFVFVLLSRCIEERISPYERELASRTLGILYANTIGPEGYVEAFEKLLGNLGEMSRDVPDAADVLGKFLARAVYDEVIPPSFLTLHGPEDDFCGGGENARLALEMALGLTPHDGREERDLADHDHNRRRLEHIWGPGDLTSVKRMKEAAAEMIKEYLVDGGDVLEADRCLRALNAPHFHWHVVKQAIIIALQRNEEDRKKISDFFKSVLESNLVSMAHMVNGFQVCRDQIEDIKLDSPNCQVDLENMIKRGVEEKYLPQEFIKP